MLCITQLNVIDLEEHQFSFFFCETYWFRAKSSNWLYLWRSKVSWWERKLERREKKTHIERDKMRSEYKHLFLRFNLLSLSFHFPQIVLFKEQNSFGLRSAHMWRICLCAVWLSPFVKSTRNIKLLRNKMSQDLQAQMYPHLLDIYTEFS